MASHGTARPDWDRAWPPERLTRRPPFVPNCASMADAPLVGGALPDGECGCVWRWKSRLGGYRSAWGSRAASGLVVLLRKMDHQRVADWSGLTRRLESSGAGCRVAGAAFRRNRAAHRWSAPAVKPVSGVLVEQFLIREGMEAGGIRVDSAGRADGVHGLREDADACSRADDGRADAQAWPERPRDR